MKTPRDILFQRHQAVDARLDQIRHAVVAQVQSVLPPRREPLLFRALLTLWRELFRPSRYAWGGIAAAWLIMLVVNESFYDGGTSTQAKATPPSAEIIRAAQAQRRMLAELTGPIAEREADRSRHERPRPHSRRETEFVLA